MLENKHCPKSSDLGKGFSGFPSSVDPNTKSTGSLSKF